MVELRLGENMAHPNATIVNIYDGTEGIKQAPAFLRQSSACEEMENLEISLQGRPILRKGYVLADTNQLNIGLKGQFTAGDQIAVLHWLGDEGTPDGIKRMYFFPKTATWVQDENGRLVYLVNRGDDPKIIDIKENEIFDWVLDPPGVNPDNENAIDMQIVGQPELNVNRDFGLIEGDFVQSGEIKIATTGFSSEYPGVFIDVRALTDIIDADVRIKDSGDNIVRTLYSGYLDQGGHRFVWNGRNDNGSNLAAGAYVAELAISDIPGKESEVKNLDVGIILGPNFAYDLAISEFHLSGQFRYMCATYFNEMLNIESRPSLISKERVYFWHIRNEDPPEFLITTFLGIANLPNWATSVNIYISEEPTTREEYVKAVETGFDFRRIGSLPIVDGRLSESDFDDYEGTIDSTSRLLDSYDHDHPVDNLGVIGAYGVGLWGAANNRVYFSKIGNQGEQRLYALPSENALVPHSFPLPKSGQSPILHVHPAAHESALMVFKRDALHVIRGRGVISGLYDPTTIVQVDVDASSVIEGLGTMSPSSVVTVGTAVYFVGSDNRFYQFAADWRGRTDIKDVGLPIQKYLNEVDNLENLGAFLYRNCYHLITPNRVIILDMTRKYWTAASWKLRDAFWSRGGVNSESILYGWTTGKELVELFEGDTDNGDAIGGVWHSNPISIPSESTIIGVNVVHTTTPSPTMRCRVDIDDVEGEAEEFIPDKSNDFQYGLFGAGSRIQVRLETDGEFPNLDRISAEIFVVR